MIRIAARIDEDGFFLGDVVYLGDEVPAGCIAERPAEGIGFPQWNGKEWKDAGGIFRTEPDGSVDPSKRFDPIERIDGSKIVRDAEGVAMLEAVSGVREVLTLSNQKIQVRE